MTPTPIKRSKNLVALSRDHHEGLLIVWKIRQGLRFEIENKRIADFTVHAFDKHLEPHFIQEEQLLFSKLAGKHELLKKAIEQHAAIREMVKIFRSDTASSTEQLEAFAVLLEEHIRFEERALFPYLEKQLPIEVLNSIGAELERQPKHVPLFWNDEFWIKK